MTTEAINNTSSIVPSAIENAMIDVDTIETYDETEIHSHFSQDIPYMSSTTNPTEEHTYTTTEYTYGSPSKTQKDYSTSPCIESERLHATPVQHPPPTNPNAITISILPPSSDPTGPQDTQILIIPPTASVPQQTYDQTQQIVIQSPKSSRKIHSTVKTLKNELPTHQPHITTQITPSNKSKKSESMKRTVVKRNSEPISEGQEVIVESMDGTEKPLRAAYLPDDTIRLIDKSPY